MFGRATIRLGIGPHSSVSYVEWLCFTLDRFGIFDGIQYVQHLLQLSLTLWTPSLPGLTSERKAAVKEKH